MKKYYVIEINKMISIGNMLYVGDNFDKASDCYLIYTDPIFTSRGRRKYCCLVNTERKRIIDSAIDRRQLFIVYDNICNAFVGVYENRYLDNYIDNKNYSIYNCYGELIKPVDKQSTTNNILRENKEKLKNKSTVSIELSDMNKLSDLEQIKLLEKYLISLRQEFPNVKIDNKDSFKDIRFTVRKSFDNPEQDYYTDLETAKSTCPPGYSVFDVLTGECIMTNELVEDKVSEDMKYKEAWNKLKEFLEDRKDTYLACADILYVETYQTALNVMKDFEGEMLKNE